MSIVLIFIHHGEVSFGTSAKLFGASLSVGNPDVIFSMLLLSLAYFLWRFYKYFYHDQAHSHLKNQYNATLSVLQDREISKQIQKQLPAGVSSYSGSTGYSQIQRFDNNCGFYEIPVGIPSGDNYEHHDELMEIHEKPIKRKKYQALSSFAFRGKILSDFYIPILLALYASAISIVDCFPLMFKAL